MPSYQEVTQRAGSLRAMMGSTAQEFTALLPLFEDALGVLSEGPHHGWATPHEPPLQSV
jgi:hypothetical protein